MCETKITFSKEFIESKQIQLLKETEIPPIYLTESKSEPEFEYESESDPESESDWLFCAYPDSWQDFVKNRETIKKSKFNNIIKNLGLDILCSIGHITHDEYVIGKKLPLLAGESNRIIIDSPIEGEYYELAPEFRVRKIKKFKNSMSEYNKVLEEFDSAPKKNNAPKTHFDEDDCFDGGFPSDDFTF
tara:strand:+ start:1167 stop:1730 length:564 start_codon:yes stop_codon:yes gene_type:complete